MIREIGDYEIIDEDPIAGPRKGKVYRAQDKRDDKLAAIRVLSPYSFQNARQFENFKQQVSAAAMLKHTNIVAVYCQTEALESIKEMGFKNPSWEDKNEPIAVVLFEKDLRSKKRE